MDIAIRTKIRREHDHLFTDVEKLRVDVREIGGFQMHLDNIFNGQQVLEESANALINNNWRELYEVLKPSITATVQTIMSDRFKKIFAFVPATYFIEDLVYQ
ncbi:uncharacterized protein LOC142241692 [Haematobia irritans]|uniref:uncharacterized protein LOC142241692 n=1 Tax=Haematobia irritans TaxID=7368 RepID=UPI003F508BAC